MDNNICTECGMLIKHPLEYHPFAACVLFKELHDSDAVRAQLGELARRADTPNPFPGQFVGA